MELPQLETRFEPLRENYRALAKFEVGTCQRHNLCMCASSGPVACSREAQVPVPESEAVQLEALEASLQNVQAALVAANGMMERTKDAFRERLMRSLDAFEHGNATARESFMANAPFSAEVSRPTPRFCPSQ